VLRLRLIFHGSSRGNQPPTMPISRQTAGLGRRRPSVTRKLKSSVGAVMPALKLVETSIDGQAKTTPTSRREREHK